MIKDINLISLQKSDDIKEALQRTKETGMRIMLIVDEGKVLIGVVTSGDIGRAILSGKKLSTPLSEVMNTNLIIAHEGTPATELLGVMLGKSIYEIPIVDCSGRVVDISFLSELKAIPLSSPDITNKEVDIINQVLSTPYLSIGSKIKEFEEKIANYLGVKYAVSVNSGTSALHLCIRSLDIKDGDEVITTPFSFVASANCMLFERAKPVFVDIDKDTLCLDVNKIEEKITAKTKAILPVHIFGHPCQMDKVMAIAQKYKLSVIEDACEALGTEYQGKKVGSFGDCGVFGFYPNKQITTGEGGMVVTNNEKLAKLYRSLRNQGRDEGDSWLSYTRLGYNYRMPELSASLGVAQIGRIDEILEKRQKVADFYNKRLSHIGGVKVPYTADEVKMSWFVYVIRLDEREFSQEQRDSIIQELKGRGIDCRDYFPPIHLEPFYVQMLGCRKGSFPITERVSMLTIALPFYNNLTEDEVNYIGDNLEDILRSY